MKFSRHSILIIPSVCFIATGIMSATESHAIPAFTRANNVECSTCHTIYPALNEYGEAFLKNGYVYFGKGKNGAQKSKPVSEQVEAKPAASASAVTAVKGDGEPSLLSKLKAGIMVSGSSSSDDSPKDTAQASSGELAGGGETKAEGIVLSGVPEHLPISFAASMHGTYDRTAVSDVDFSTRSLKLNAGGNFKRKVGFFGTYLLYTENTVGLSNTSQIPTNMNEKNDIGELFVVFRHAFDTPVNVKVGRFQPKLGLWKANNKLSMTNSYATYSYTVGQSSFKAEQPQDALEANAIIANRLFFATGMVNRKEQNTKEWYVHTSAKFGGADYLTNEPDIDLSKDESIFDFLTVTVGGYGYVGTNGEPNNTPGVKPRQNEFYRAGADIDLMYKVYRLKLSTVLGNDDSPSLVYKPVKTHAVAVEGEYTILQNLIGALRFEYTDDGVQNVRRFIPTFAYTPIENVKIAAEYKHEYGTAKVALTRAEILNKIGTLGVTISF
ncbi:MAG: hypothetical protein PHN84_15595 [Desulfuromonadaceae bacterium]|nr:hypothetical protein [Desulfuromonadaceae bacterium]MDD2856039.1 hypothetical protein [Desulfuromonadaceae bacterium]